MMLGATNALWHHVQMEFVIHVVNFFCFQQLGYEICIYAPLLKMKSRISSLPLDYIQAFLTACTLLPCWHWRVSRPAQLLLWNASCPSDAFFPGAVPPHLTTGVLQHLRMPAMFRYSPFVRALPLLPSAPHPFPVWCRSTNCESET